MTEISGADRRWLEAAARLARTAIGAMPGRSPVAALVVEEANQVLLGRGVTGRVVPLAETQAIEEARGFATGSTIYTTLEPTSLWGRTPPPTEAIIKHRLRRVVVGALHPDPAQAGRGIERLREAGIEVVPANHDQSLALYAAEHLSHRLGRPFVVGKLIISRDGMVGRAGVRQALPGSSQTERFIQMLRATCDGTMIGARAAQADDPKLFVRLKGMEARIYQRFVLVGAGTLDPSINLVAGVSGYPTAVVAVPGRQFDIPEAVDLIVADGRQGRPDLRRLMSAITARGVVTLLVEGGARLHESFLAAELVDRFHLIETPETLGRGSIPATLLGGIDGRLRAAGLVEVDQRPLGPDKLRTFERE